MGECFEHETVFPIIAAVIRQVSATKVSDMDAEPMGFALHDELAHALLLHEQGRAVIEAALQRCPHHDDSWMADNMIQWWSQRYTTKQNDWAHHFQRKRIAGSWAYRPKAALNMPTTAIQDTYQSIPLARKVWSLLIDLASVHQSIQSQDVVARLHAGRSGSDAHDLLVPIKAYCLQHGLPPLHTIVVDSGMERAHRKARGDHGEPEAVFNYDWKSRRPLVPSEAEFVDAMQRRLDEQA